MSDIPRDTTVCDSAVTEPTVEASEPLNNNPTAGPVKRQARSCRVPHDIQLAERYLADRTNSEARESFAECCLRKLKRICSQIASRPGMCPSFLNPNTFAEDVLSLAAAQVGAKLHTLRNPQSLGSWLYGIAYHAACDERNQIRRRGSEPCYWETVERIDNEGNTVPVPDLLPEHDASYCSHDSCEAQVIREDAVSKLLAAANDVPPRDRDSISCLLLHAAGFTPHELAAERGITTDQVSAIFRKGRKRCRRIAEQKFQLRAWKR